MLFECTGIWIIRIKSFDADGFQKSIGLGETAIAVADFRKTFNLLENFFGYF